MAPAHINILFICAIFAMCVQVILGVFFILIRMTPEGYIVLAAGVVCGIASRALYMVPGPDPASDIGTVSPL